MFFPGNMSEKYSHVISDGEVLQLRDAEVLLADNNSFVQVSTFYTHTKFKSFILLLNKAYEQFLVII